MSLPNESLNCWLSIIQKGRVTSTYKMALGFAIARLVEKGKRQVSMGELAKLFFEIYLDRLEYGLPQTSNPDEPTVVEQVISKFEKGYITMQQAIFAIEKDGFRYVLDAFHRLPEGESPVRFYQQTGSGITLTDAAYQVFLSPEKDLVMREMDARWSEIEETYARKRLGSNVLAWVASNKAAADTDSFLWCRANASEGSITDTGRGVGDFAYGVTSDLLAGYKVSLGFEHPLYIGIPKNPDVKAIPLGNESDVAEGPGPQRHFGYLPKNRFALGLSETAWVFQKVKAGTGQKVSPTFEWRRFVESKGNLFIWEAAVVGERNIQRRVSNAELAARSFLTLYPRLPAPEISKDSTPFSMAAAALMWAGFQVNREVLSSPCVVVKAS